MTKEDIIIKINNILEDDIIRADAITDLIEDIYSQNVVIPRGQSRHPYADVLHEMTEDMTKKIQVAYIKQDFGWSTFDSYLDYAFRIQPSEPVYEYMYYDRVGGTLWSTKDDAPINMWCAEETKRVRQ